jgi:hypothetical protein
MELHETASLEEHGGDVKTPDDDEEAAKPVRAGAELDAEGGRFGRARGGAGHGVGLHGLASGWELIDIATGTTTTTTSTSTITRAAAIPSIRNSS